MSEAQNLTFTQRNGLSALPQQLALGQTSQKFIALIWGAIYSDMRSDVESSYYSSYFGSRWKSIIYDFNIEFLSNTNPQSINYDVDDFASFFEKCIKQSNFGPVFDIIEYILNHGSIATSTKSKIRSAFEKSHLAYRALGDNTIIAVGTAEQAHAVQNALDVSSSSSLGTFSHLKSAAAALAHENWALSVRESITAVEAAARFVAGDSATLGDALKELGKRNVINPQLKSALEKLYAYTNAEGGIRHANIFSDKPNVNEDDALFMLGACASFVTFMLSKYSAD